MVGARQGNARNYHGNDFYTAPQMISQDRNRRKSHKMDKINGLTKLQNAIAQALIKIGDRKTPYTDSILLKEIRSLYGIENKKNATVRLADLEKTILALKENNLGCWSVHLDAVNNMLIKKVEAVTFLNQEDKSNRLRSEKSMVLLTDKDLSEGKSKNTQKKFQKKKKFSFDEE